MTLAHTTHEHSPPHFDGVEVPAGLPQDLEQALATGGLDSLLLDVQGTGIMVDEDIFSEGEDLSPADGLGPAVDEPAPDVQPEAPLSPQNERKLLVLRAQLGVSSTAPSVRPREAVGVVTKALPVVEADIRNEAAGIEAAEPATRGSVGLPLALGALLLLVGGAFFAAVLLLGVFLVIV